MAARDSSIAWLIYLLFALATACDGDGPEDPRSGSRRASDAALSVHQTGPRGRPWLEQHPAVRTAQGLAAYLDGPWVSVRIHAAGDERFETRQRLVFSGDRLESVNVIRRFDPLTGARSEEGQPPAGESARAFQIGYENGLLLTHAEGRGEEECGTWGSSLSVLPHDEAYFSLTETVRCDDERREIPRGEFARTEERAEQLASVYSVKYEGYLEQVFRSAE
jgi:hypothetical protein